MYNKIRKAMISNRIIKGFALVQLCFLLYIKLAAAAYSTSFDFGNIAVDTTSVTTVTIYNQDSHAVEVTGLAFISGGCSDFSVISQKEPGQIPAGGNLEIDVGYTPSAVGECSGILRIWTDSPIPSTVAFTGTGVVTRAILTNKMIEILAYLDKMMTGNGPGKSVNNRLLTIRNMVKTATLQIESGQTEAAYNKLSVIYKKVDGFSKPMDFINEGSSRGLHSKNTLSELIKDLMTLLKSDLKKTGKRVEFKSTHWERENTVRTQPYGLVKK
jgi:hypothetical protein